MILLPDIKKAFISIPKCASTSLMMAIKPRSVDFTPDIYHASFFETASLSKNIDFSVKFTECIYSEISGGEKNNFDLENYIIYAILRDPLKRIKSIYFDAISDPNHTALFEVANLKNLDEFWDYFIDNRIEDLPRHFWPYEFFLSGVKPKNLKLFEISESQICFDRIASGTRLQGKALGNYRQTGISMRKHNIFLTFKSLINPYQQPKILLKIKKKLKSDYALYNSLLKNKRLNNLYTENSSNAKGTLARILKALE